MSSGLGYSPAVPLELQTLCAEIGAEVVVEGIVVVGGVVVVLVVVVLVVVEVEVGGVVVVLVDVDVDVVVVVVVHVYPVAQY